MAMEPAIAYTRIPAGAFTQCVAAVRPPAHGGHWKPLQFGGVRECQASPDSV
jgi:hypothetical protein